MRQGIGKAIIPLILAILAASAACAATSQTTVALGCREFLVDSVPVSIGNGTYVGLDVVGVVCASYVSGNRAVDVTLPNGDEYELPATLYKGKTMVSLADLAKAAGLTASWESGARTLRLIPHVISAKYANGSLVVTCNYPIRVESRLFEGLKVFAVDISPARLQCETREVPIAEGNAIKARIGQFGANEVRVAIDLSKPVKLVPVLGKKLTDVSIPIAPKPVATPVTPPTTVTPGGKPQVTGLTFQPVDDERSKLLISTTGKVTTRPFVLKEPERLVIDLIGAKIAPGAGQELTVTHPVVKSVRAAQFQQNPDIVRVVLDLTRSVTFSIMQTDPAQVVIEVGGGYAQQGIKGAMIVIDPGHGGSQSGAISPDGLVFEKNINLAVAKRLSDLLQAAGASVLLTRYDDIAIGLPDRPKLATDVNASVFVSIHCNSVGVSNKISGTETYYHLEDPICKDLAEDVQRAVVKSAETNDRKARSDTMVYASGFSVLRNATVPAILVELGYLDHYADRKKLVSSDYQQKFAKGVFEGIKTFLGGETVGTSDTEINVSSY